MKRHAPYRFVSLDNYPAGDTFPYWERENTGDPELFAQEYIDYCINNLYPDVGCPGVYLRLILFLCIAILRMIYCRSLG